jgi:hypothetical protein
MLSGILMSRPCFINVDFFFNPSPARIFSLLLDVSYMPC